MSEKCRYCDVQIFDETGMCFGKQLGDGTWECYYSDCREIMISKFNRDLIVFRELYKYSKIAVNQIICMGEGKDNILCQPCDNREDLARTLYNVENILREYE